MCCPPGPATRNGRIMRMRCTMCSAEERVSELGTKTRKFPPEACSSSPPKLSTASTTSQKNWQSWFSSRPRRGRSSAGGLLFVGRYPINLFLDGSLICESAPLQNCLAVLDHLRMPAQVSQGVARIELPMIGVFAQNVVRPPDFTRPVFVIPRPADRRHILEPRQFFIEMVQFIEISEFPGTARAIQQEQLVGSVESALFPFFVERAHIAHKWSHAGHGRDQQMIRPSILCVQRKSSFGHLAHQQLVAGLHLVQQRRKRAFRHQFEEKLHFSFRRRRRNRIWTLDALSISLDSQRRVLPRDKVELPSTADAEHPQVGSEIDALGNLRVVELFIGNRHLTWPQPFKLLFKNPAASQVWDAATLDSAG